MVLPQLSVELGLLMAVELVLSVPVQPPVLWDSSTRNMQKNTTPNLRETKEFNAPIDINLTNDPIAPSVSVQILGDELPDSYSCDIYSWCRMKFMEETGQPMAPQFVSRGLTTLTHWIKLQDMEPRY